MKARSEGVSPLYNAFQPASTALKTAIKINKKQDETATSTLKPLEFHTGEALGSTPAIFQSLSASNFGPQTFVCDNPNSCPTFVIPADAAQYPSYVIDTADVDSGVDLGRKDDSPTASPSEHSDEISLLRKEIEKYEDLLKNKDDEIDKLTMQTNNKDLQGQLAALSAELSLKDVELSRARESPEDRELIARLQSELSQIAVELETKTQELQHFTSKQTDSNKEDEIERLQHDLEKTAEALRLKNDEVERLTRIRNDGERELEDLTASLFQEAHKMVRIANEKQALAEKTLAESQMKVEVLMAEVAALKTLVLTSTPSMPNAHLHPQLNGSKDEQSQQPSNITTSNSVNKRHRRSPSHFNLKYGRESSLPDSPVDEKPVLFSAASGDCLIGDCTRDALEVDPTLHKEFMAWRENPRLDKEDPFIARIYREDINLCLDFNNKVLASEVCNAAETRNIYIEAVSSSDKTKNVFPRKCALLEVNRQCHYRMRLGDQENWHSISHICRNRITAVCDFLNYLRYIELGLVKSTVHEVYWEIIRLRKEMVLARLGLTLSSS